MAKSKPLPQWRAHDWPGEDREFIESRLSERRNDITAILSIDVNDKQTRLLQSEPLSMPSGCCFIGYMELRRRSNTLDYVASIDLAVEELSAILGRFIGNLTNKNGLASDAIVRRTLKAIASLDEIADDDIKLLDPRVREVIAGNYPGGRELFARGRVVPGAMKVAATLALGDRPKTKSGRPSGTTNDAAAELIRELANFFENHGERRATRVVTLMDAAHSGGQQSVERGPFHEFCKLAIEALPPGAQGKVTKRGGGLASLIRCVTTRTAEPRLTREHAVEQHPDN